MMMAISFAPSNSHPESFLTDFLDVVQEDDLITPVTKETASPNLESEQPPSEAIVLTTLSTAISESELTYQVSNIVLSPSTISDITILYMELLLLSNLP
ncbi:hypothetical protein L6452_39080 [Arctium lappa]|uniref:Uncharacterized protein n=1 Tax=Arctium lappa TaxID=4217 RepID=A0ACB8XQU2_ARCLA|nr:hypothetical protein L6452_39080 [Arctium lappa]